MLRRIQCIALPFGLALHLYAAKPEPVEPGIWWHQAWQTEEGLPDNVVSGAVQASDGYLWFSTLGGLVRFNGSHFQEFSPMSLAETPNRLVRSMLLDSRNRFWLAMDRGPILCVSSNAVSRFDVYDRVPEGRTTVLAEDGSGGVWFSSVGRLFRISGNEIIVPGPEQGLSTSVDWAAADRKGVLWIAANGQLGTFCNGGFRAVREIGPGVVRFAGASGGGLWICEGNRLFRLAENGTGTELPPLPDRSRPSCLLEDTSGALWAGTVAGGLFRYYAGNLQPVSTSHPGITCLLEDREGNIWAGTAGGGINRVRTRVLELMSKASGLPSQGVRSVAEAVDGTVWVVAQGGAVFRGDGQTWTNFTLPQVLTDQNATCVNVETNGTVWIGTTDRGLVQVQTDGKIRRWRKQDGLAGLGVRSLMIDSKGGLWVATDTPPRLHLLSKGRLQVLKMPRPTRSLRALAEDAQGRVYAGSADGQVLVVEDGELRDVPAIAEPRPLSIRCLQGTPDGSLWIGYAGWGIGRLKGNEYARITTAHGLGDDYVSQILPDGKGRVWISGNRGVSHVGIADLIRVAEGRTNRIRSIGFTRGEGVRSIQPNIDNFPSAFAGRSGRLWLALFSGLGTIHSNGLRDNPVPPPIVLERMLVDDVPMAVYDSRSPFNVGDERPFDLRGSSNPFELRAGHRKLEIEFAALSYTSPENVSFRYRLLNFDPEWVEAEGQRSARYPQLPPGDYEFQVQACNNTGVWNETGAGVRLKVLPFFWQTWWFRGIVVASFTLALAGAVRYFSFRRLQRKLERLERMAALQRERSRIARDMHDEVGSKLSRLSLLSEMAVSQGGLTAEAEKEVAEIAEAARESIRSLEEIVWAVNPKNDTLPVLSDYLCRFAEDLFEGSQTQCTFDLPAVIPPVALPTEVRHNVFLAAKEALNNVLKHASARRVSLQLAVTPSGGFRISVSDDGCGFPSGSQQQRLRGGNGMENMRERMRSVGGNFQVDSTPGGGTRVSLEVPSLPTGSDGESLEPVRERAEVHEPA